MLNAMASLSSPSIFLSTFIYLLVHLYFHLNLCTFLSISIRQQPTNPLWQLLFIVEFSNTIICLVLLFLVFFHKISNTFSTCLLNWIYLLLFSLYIFHSVNVFVAYYCRCICIQKLFCAIVGNNVLLPFSLCQCVLSMSNRLESVTQIHTYVQTL